MICAKQTKSIWLVSILVSICLAVVFCPLLKSEAWAATGELKNYKAYLIDSATGDMAYFGTFNDAWGDAIHRQLDSFTVGLLDDQHIYREYGLSFKRSANVELNGHKLFKENNKNHADGGIFTLGNANLTIYGGRQSWTFDGPINNGGKAKVSLPAEASNRIAGEYYDENGFAQASGTESKNTVWNLAYSNIDKSVKKAQLSKNEYTVKGGLISGGWKTDGGAIDMSGRDTVAIYDVTLAGNTGDNNGGAIAMLGSYERLTLTDSRIAFNRARCDDGGGIFVKGDFCRVKMVRSHLDYNYANDNGGGIAITGKNAQITGDASALHPADPEYPANWASGTYTDHPYFKLSAKENPFWNKADNDSSKHVGTAGKLSTVAYNVVPNSDVDGGGSAIYVDGKSASVSGLNIIKNVALGGSFSGRGAVHLNTESNSVSNCNIWKNWSRSEGGGIFVDNDGSGISAMTITDNYADTSGWSGGGVYVLGTSDLALGGKCIIMNNKSYGKPSDNLLLAYNNTMNARLYPALSSDSEVWIAATSSMKDITKVKGVYDDRVFWADENDRHVEYKDNILKFVKVTKQERTDYPGTPSNLIYRNKKYPAISESQFAPDESAITSGSRTKKVNTYTSEKGNTYNLYQGVAEFPAFADTSKDLSSTFFYSDGYFDRNPTSYDVHLATASMHLAVASFYSNDGNKGGTLYNTQGSEADGTYYPIKSNNIRQFMSDIGVAESDIFLNDFNIERPGADTIGVAIGSKKIKLGGADKTLVVVGVRGAGYEQEWVSNMTMGRYGEAQGFASAANQVFSELEKYLASKGIDGASENTVFWVAGYSRAGATSNLTGARIVDKYDAGGTHTFVYTFSAPQGGLSQIRDNSGNKYYCIHNVLNPCDIVPEVGPAIMGFHRYGVDHYMPGGVAGTRQSSTGKYEGSNQEGKPIGEKSYTTWRDNDAYSVGDSNYNSQKGQMLNQLKYIAGYDITFSDYFHPATMKYLKNTVLGGYGAQLMEETSRSEWSSPATFNRIFLNDLITKVLKTNASEYYRGNYVDKMEGSLSAVAGVAFGLTGSQMEKLMEIGLTAMDRIDKTALYTKFLKGWGSKSAEQQAKEIWEAMAVPTDDGRAKGWTYLSDEGVLTPGQYSVMQKSMPGVLTLLLKYLKDDYKSTGNDTVGTLGYNVTRILMNHYPEVNLAWVRSFDSYYNEQNGKVKMADSAKVNKVKEPMAVTDEGKYVPSIKLVGENPKLTLGVEGDVNSGANIYYRFYYGDGVDFKLHPYCGPITIPAYSTMSSFEYKLEAFAIHDGIRSDVSRITVNADVVNTFTYETPGLIASNKNAFPIAEGRSYSFEAPTQRTKAFKQWAWTTDQAAGEAGLSGLDMKSQKNTFKVEKQGKYGVKAEYYEKSNQVSLELGEATPFMLPTTAELKSATNLSGTENTKEGVTVPVAWSHASGDVYVATIALPVDADEELCYIGQASGFIFKSYDSVLKASVAVNAASGQTSASPGGSGGLTAGQVPGMAGSVVLDPIDNSLMGFVRGDGSAVVRQAFTVAGYTDPAEATTVTVSARDMNTGGPVPFASGEDSVSFTVKKGEKATLPIPVVTSESFVDVESATGVEVADVTAADGVLSFTAPDDEVDLVLNYKPLVNEVVFVLGGVPEAGKEMPALLGAVATIENSWAIADGIDVSWAPAATVAGYDIPYTMELALKPSALRGAQVTNEDAKSWSEAIEGLDPQELSGVFDFAENVTLSVCDADGVDLGLHPVCKTDESGNLAISFDFNPTASAKVDEIEDPLPVNVDYTDSPSASVLPATVDVVLEDGTMAEVNATWALDSYSADPNGYTVAATASLSSDKYDLSDFENPKAYCSIVVGSQMLSDVPEATLLLGGVEVPSDCFGKQPLANENGDPVVDGEDNPVFEDVVLMIGDGGDYSAQLALSGAEGATIRYSYTTDGTTPDDPTSESDVYDGAIEIGWGDEKNPNPGSREVVVKACAFEEGKQASDVAMFTCHLEAVPAFVSQSLVLGDQIGVNFYVSQPAIEGVDYTNSYMEFTVKGKTTRVNYDAAKPDDSGMVGFTCYVNAIEMAEPITAVFNYGNGMTETKTYSVKQYIQTFDDNAASYDAETVALVKAIADYGHYAQVFLSKERGWKIGKDYADMDKFYTSAYDFTALGNAFSALPASRVTMAKDMKNVFYSLMLYADMTLNVRFVHAAGYSGGLSVTVDGKDVQAAKQANGAYVVRIPNIAPHQMATVHTVIVKTDAGETKLEASALSYASAWMTRFKNAETKNIGAAIYKYYEAANAYKASH